MEKINEFVNEDGKLKFKDSLRFKPGDYIIIKSDELINKHMQEILNTLKSQFPNNRVGIFPLKTEFEILRNDGDDLEHEGDTNGL